MDIVFYMFLRFAHASNGPWHPICPTGVTHLKGLPHGRHAPKKGCPTGVTHLKTRKFTFFNEF